MLLLVLNENLDFGCTLVFFRLNLLNLRVLLQNQPMVKNGPSIRPMDQLMILRPFSQLNRDHSWVSLRFRVFHFQNILLEQLCGIAFPNLCWWLFLKFFRIFFVFILTGGFSVEVELGGRLRSFEGLRGFLKSIRLEVITFERNWFEVEHEFRFLIFTLILRCDFLLWFELVIRGLRFEIKKILFCSRNFLGSRLIFKFEASRAWEFLDFFLQFWVTFQWENWKWFWRLFFGLSLFDDFERNLRVQRQVLD